MRWKGIIALLVLAAIVFVLGLFLTDSWLEGILEKTASNALQAKVEIDNLDVSLLQLHFKWDSLQVTDPKDPWKNMLTSGKTEYDMEFYPLLYNKVVIDNVQLSNVTWGTERTTDGTWKTKSNDGEKKPGFISKTIDRLETKVSDVPELDFSSFSGKVNVDSIIAILDLSAPAKIDSLQSGLRETYTQWDDTFAKTNITQDLDDMKTRINSINPNEIKSVDKLQSTLTTLKTIQGDMDSLKQFVKTSKSGIGTDIEQSRNGLKSMDDWVRDDISAAMDKAKLPDISTQEIGILLFGSQVVSRVNRVLSLTSQARGYAEKFKSDKPKKEKPPRYKGQTVHFSGKNVFPSFWIKKIELSGLVPNQYQFSGIVNDIVSEQPIIGKTTTFEIKGAKANSSALNLTGELDYMGESPEEHFALDASNLAFNDVPLSSTKILPSSITKGAGRVQAKLDVLEEQLSGNVDFTGSQMGFAFAESEGKTAAVVRDVFTDISTVNFKAGYTGTPDDTDFSLDSNLDNVVANALKSMVGDEVDKAKQKIRSAVNAKVDAKKQQVEQLVADKNAELQKRIDDVEARVNEYQKQIDDKKKEVEARIEEEKKNVTNKIKGIF